MRRFHGRCLWKRILFAQNLAQQCNHVQVVLLIAANHKRSIAMIMQICRVLLVVALVIAPMPALAVGGAVQTSQQDSADSGEEPASISPAGALPAGEIQPQEIVQVIETVYITDYITETVVLTEILPITETVVVTEVVTVEQIASITETVVVT
ncbi:MAG: hypothetical protein ACK47M_09025, partial [Caldilinea sp.]